MGCDHRLCSRVRPRAQSVLANFNFFAEENFDGMGPVVAAGPLPAGFSETFAEGLITDELFECGGELSRMMGRDKQTGCAVHDGFGDPANGVSDDRQSVCSRFKVNQSKSLHAVAIINAGHAEYISAIIDTTEFVVRNITEEAHRKVTLVGGGAEGGFVTGLGCRTDQPVFDFLTKWRGQRTEGVESDQLTLAGV